MTRPPIGLVVVGYESDDVWPEFFSSLGSSTLKPEHVVVVENSPTLSPTLASMYSGPLTIVHRPENPGYGASCNDGAALISSQCSIIVACNPDVVFSPEALGTLVDALLANTHVGVVGPRIVNRDGSVYPSARAFPGIRVGVGHALFARLWPANPWTRRYLGSYEGRDTKVVDWLSGALLMVRRSAFEEIGGFDPRYFMFLEDVDLCFRLKRRGWRSLYVPQAQIMHSGAHSTSKVMENMVRVHHESAALFLDRLYDKPWQLPLRVTLHLGLRIRRFFAVRRFKDAVNS